MVHEVIYAISVFSFLSIFITVVIIITITTANFLVALLVARALGTVGSMLG